MDALPEIAVPIDRPTLDAIPHGPFLVDPDGALSLRPPDPPVLHFAWRGRACEARITEGGIRLSASAGAVPYTAERSGDRPAALAAILALPGALPPGWGLRVRPDHRLTLETGHPLPEPITATAIVGAMVGFALALDPYLDRLESAGIASGSAKT